jgi:hypothetical protein
MRIHVTDTGEVIMSGQAVGRVEGPQRSPRTAAILVLVALGSADWSFH